MHRADDRQSTWWNGWLVFGLLLTLGGLVSCGNGGGSGEGEAGKSAEVPGETDIVSSVAEMAKGDIVLLPFTSGQATLSLSGGTADAGYALLVQSARQTAATSTLTVADVATMATELGKALFDTAEETAQTDLETFLRAAETMLTEVSDPLDTSVSLGKSVAKAVSVGSSGSFRILSSLNSISSYSTVSATAQCVNNRVAVYVDAAFDASVMGSGEYATLCTQFKGALDAEFALLGDPPDINGDGVVTVLMTPKVNALGGSGGGIVTGFFFAGDLLARNAGNPASNEQEIVFVLVPDPDGTYGTKISKDFAMSNLLTAVVPHEVQHLLSYHYHVLTNGGASETTWLNEAMAHLIEDVTGYGQENPSRVALYLASPHDSPLIPSASPDLSERGGLYLFLRFMYEQAGSDSGAFLKNLVQTSRSGVDNVLAAFGTSRSGFDDWGDFLRRWGVAVAAMDAHVTTDARYTYRARTWNTATSHWQGVCLVCDADDGRSTTLTGPTRSTYGSLSVSLRASAGAFFDLSTPPATLSLAGSDDADLQGVLLRTE